MERWGLRRTVLRLLIAMMAMGSIGASAQERKPDLVLKGTITEANRETYVEVPFTVPAKVLRVSVDFQYTGHDKRRPSIWD